MCLLDLLDGAGGEFVAKFVADISGMTFDPVPGDFVTGDCSIKSAPEVIIFNRFLILGAPTVTFPIPNPAGNTLTQVFGVGEEIHFTLFLQSSKCFNGSLEFHAIVGGGRGTAGKFTRMWAKLQDCCPAARTRIAMACAISVNGDFFHVRKKLNHESKQMAE